MFQRSTVEFILNDKASVVKTKFVVIFDSVKQHPPKEIGSGQKTVAVGFQLKGKQKGKNRKMMEEENLQIEPLADTISGLPVEIVEFILLKMDCQSVIRMTEVSKTLSEIVKNNEQLTTKLNLQLNYPSDLMRFASDILNTTRSYRKLSIIRTRDRGEIDDRMSQRIFAKLGRTVKDLTVDCSQSQRSRTDQRMFELNDRHRAFIEVMRRRRDMHADQEALRDMEEAFQQNIVMRNRFNVPLRDEFQSELANIFRHFPIIVKLCLKFVNLGHDFEQFRLDRMAAGQFEDDDSDDDEERAEADPRGMLDEVEVVPVVNEPASFRWLKEVQLYRCDAQCFVLISSATQLQKLHIVEVSWPHRSPSVSTFERFLVSQTSLKVLHFERVDISQLFQNIRPDDIQFRLDSLLLQDVTMQNRQMVNAFLITQTELKSIDFTMRTYAMEQNGENFFNNILRTMCSLKKLKEITLTKRRYRLENVEFLFDISNSSVQRLTYHVTNEDSTHDLFKAFIRMFPCLQSISFTADETDEPVNGICFENDTTLAVQELSIKNASLRSLERITAPMLETFICDPGKTGQSIDVQFNDFFLRHQTIKKLVLGNDSPRSYFFINHTICQYIADYLPLIEHITIYKFETVNKPIQFLLEKLTKLKTLTVTAEDHGKVSKSTLTKIIAKNVELRYDQPDKSPPQSEASLSAPPQNE